MILDIIDIYKGKKYFSMR